MACFIYQGEEKDREKRTETTMKISFTTQMKKFLVFSHSQRLNHIFQIANIIFPFNKLNLPFSKQKPFDNNVPDYLNTKLKHSHTLTHQHVYVVCMLARRNFLVRMWYRACHMCYTSIIHATFNAMSINTLLVEIIMYQCTSRNISLPPCKYSHEFNPYKVFYSAELFSTSENLQWGCQCVIFNRNLHFYIES